MAKTKTIITIGREFGSGGREIGAKLADKLDIKFYDKEMLERAAEESEYCQEIFETHDEKATSSFLYSLVMDTYSYKGSAAFTDMPLDQKVFLAQFHTIKNIAEEGPCVLVGRCADYALEERKDVLNVYIYADLQARIHRIAKQQNITEAKAKDIIQKTDKSRASYYNYYTNKQWGEARSYDVCLDSSKLGIDGTIEAIIDVVQLKEQVGDQATI